MYFKKKAPSARELLYTLFPFSNSKRSSSRQVHHHTALTVSPLRSTGEENAKTKNKQTNKQQQQRLK